MDNENLPTPVKEYAEIAHTHQRAIDILRSNGTNESITLMVEAKLQEIVEHVLEKHSVNLLSYLAVEH